MYRQVDLNRFKNTLTNFADGDEYEMLEACPAASVLLAHVPDSMRTLRIAFNLISRFFQFSDSLIATLQIIPPLSPYL